jgi:rod shape-determining protein MreC
MLFLTALAIALMVFDKRADTFAQLRAALSMPLAPLQSIVNWPVQWIGHLETAFSSHDQLVKENLDLKAEQLLMKAQMQRWMALETENNQLKALLRSSTQVQGKVLVARLLSIATDPFVNQVTIDKSSRDNLFVGQPVLDANGVMGQVIHVGPLSSKVLLINDPHSGVPVQITRNGVRAIAVGDAYTGKLRLANVPQTTDIRVGDVLITSGLGENYPEGYPVGQVTSVIKDPGLQFMTIAVEPSARLDRSREVLLVWPNKIVQYVAPVQPKPVELSKPKQR